MAMKKCILPSREVMLARLFTVNDSEPVKQRLYPKLLEHAGEERIVVWIVVILQLALYEYTRGMPTDEADALHEEMPRFIKALAPNEETAKEAMEFWDQVKQNTKNLQDKRKEVKNE